MHTFVGHTGLLVLLLLALLLLFVKFEKLCSFCLLGFDNCADTVRSLAVMPDLGIISASHDG